MSSLEGRDLINRNASGYPDPTAAEAIRRASRDENKEIRDEDEKRFHDLLNAIFYISRVSGFRVEERIVLKDEKTGKIWR